MDSYLKRSYPKEEGKEPYTLARPGLHGDLLGGPTRTFLTGLMLLSGLILLAACANLGSLFAARAADHSREVALRLALGSSRNRILRQLFTESLLLSFAGGYSGTRGKRSATALVERVAAISAIPPPCAGKSGRQRLFGSFGPGIGERSSLRHCSRAPDSPTNPYEIVKAGSTGAFGRRITVRDVLLVPGNCDLRRAGHFIDGCCAWTHALECTATSVLSRGT